MPGGRPRIPTETLKVRGTFRADRRSLEPQVKPAAPPPPAIVEEDPEALALWKRLAPALKRRRTLTREDQVALAGLCGWWSQYLWAMRQLREKRAGSTLDILDLARLSGMASDAYRNYVRGCQEFGLTPASKSKVEALPAENKAAGKARFFAG